MLSDYELYNYFDEHDLSQDAREYILSVRRNGPSREVGKYANGNVIASFYSEKMKCDIKAESHTIELVFAQMCEFDDTILEYYAQPDAVDIYPITQEGRQTRHVYTSDFLVLSSSGPRIVQTKSKTQLDKLVVRQPNNWKTDGERYFHLPAIAAFQRKGLHHQVTYLGPSASILSVNIGLLLQAERLCPSELSSLAKTASSLFNEKAWMSLKDLRNGLRLRSLAPIFSLLRAKRLYCLLDNQLLSEEESAIVSPSSEHLAHGFAQFASEKLVIGDINVSISTEKVPSAKQAALAIARLARLEENSRTGRRLRNLVEEGKKKGMSAFQSLIPQIQKRGNRKPKIAAQVQLCLTSYFDSAQFSNAKNTSKYNSYNQYVCLAKTEHPNLKPVSRTTFTAKTGDIDSVEHARRRKGRRGANAAKSPSPTEHRIIKSSVPFAIATVDHYNVDLVVELGRENNKPITARCWLTALVDLATNDVLAWYFSLHPPSRVSCSMVIRDCIRRHNKVPAVIITDGGAEFRSDHFYGMLRSLGMQLRRRPADASRYGSEVERIFGEFKEERLDMLPGNIKCISHDRSVSSSHSPYKTAALTPEDLIREFDIWVSWRRTKMIGASIRTIEEKVQQKSELYDFVGQSAVLDEATLILTAIDSKTYVVDRRRGIHTGDGLHYWHPKLAQVPDGGRVEVRKEPEDPYRIYALVNDEWVTCTSTEETVFQQKGHISQRADALRFFTPHALKQQRRLEARQRLISIQGSASLISPVTDLPGEERSPAAKSIAVDVFDGIELEPDDELLLNDWSDR